MQTFFNRIAWARMQQYISRYSSHRILVSGGYGRTLVANMVFAAIKEHRHVRLGYPVQDEADIPLSMLGVTHEKVHENMISFLIGTKKRELAEKEPDIIITELPILKPDFASDAVKKILPNMVVLHHIGSEHLDLFGTSQNLIHEYEEMLYNLASDTVLVANSDDEHVKTLTSNARVKLISYGRYENANIRLTRAVRGESRDGIFIELLVNKKSYESFLPNLFAKEHVSALLAAVACAHVRGIDISYVLNAVKKMHIPHGALQMIETSRGATILTEHMECPEQMIESLKTLGSLPHSGRKIAVLGDCEQLGSETISLHEKIGAQAAEIAPYIIFVGDMMRAAQKVVDSQQKNIDTHHFVTSQEAATWINQHIKSSDMIYIAGGKSMDMELIVERLCQN
ncbi:MAG TPA: Mur ligase family protein [Candidatus Andersenbacteria bacterium]|nr:Mur ligase family protein [Candidatus Andersenbacteria bacterium]